MDADPRTIVCTLPAEGQAQRRLEIQRLLENRTGLIRHSDGIELEWAFTEQTAQSLLDFILFERTCCGRFTYELSFSPPHHGVSLRLRAPREQVEALQALYC